MCSSGVFESPAIGKLPTLRLDATDAGSGDTFSLPSIRPVSTEVVTDSGHEESDGGVFTGTRIIELVNNFIIAHFILFFLIVM